MAEDSRRQLDQETRELLQQIAKRVAYRQIVLIDITGRGIGFVSSVDEKRRFAEALRPEFTPTLARMYAAKANSLSKPTRWFSICQYFRAERPQRGRWSSPHRDDRRRGRSTGRADDEPRPSH